MMWILHSAFVQAIVGELDILPTFLYYELLLKLVATWQNSESTA